MVEYTLDLDSIFGSLADATRRDILRRVAKARSEMSVSAVAAPYNQTLAAISKHLQVLEKAQLIIKRRRGKQTFIALSPPAFNTASQYLLNYQKLWGDRFDRLDALLAKQ